MHFFHVFKFRITLLLIFILFTPVSFPLAAQTDDSSEDLNKKKNFIKKMEPGMDKTQERISRGVTSTAYWIDSFFKDETYQVEENTTHLWLRMDAFQESGESTDFNFIPKLKLVLPYAEKRIHLEIVSSADEDLEFSDERPPLQNRQFTQLRKQPTSATLRYFIKTRDTLNLSLAGGAFMDDGKAHFFAGPRSRISFKFDPFEITLKEWLKWISHDGLESNTDIYFDYDFNEQFLFRTSLEGDWSDKEDEFLHSISFLLYHALSERRMLVYIWDNLFTNRPNHRMEETRIRLKYRQQIWRDWMYAEIAPQLSFPRENDFRRTPGILFRIEFFFGPED
jgi:hypothetical protein